MTFEDYVPRPDDILWAIQMLTLVAHEGILSFPTTKLIYRVNHKEKILTLLNPEILGDEDEGEYSTVVHRRTIATFREVGYFVGVQEDSHGQP